MSAVSFRRPCLRPDVEITKGDDGATLTWMGGRRFLELSFEADKIADYHAFFDALRTPGREPIDFPGTDIERSELFEALDEQGMLAESDAPGEALSGLAVYLELRRRADDTRARLHSPLVAAITEGRATREHLIGYAIEYWHITHLCPRALAPVLARDDLAPGVWDKLMAFYQLERNHDRMLEKSLSSVGITREQLLETQPLPATAAMMAALGVYAADFPLALLATLFPMEEPEPEFLELFSQACKERDLPSDFLRPIVAHSDVNDDEQHGNVSLELLARSGYIATEELDELTKAVCDILEQRARLDAEIVAWYGRGGLRRWKSSAYPVALGEELTCASSNWQR